MELNTQTALESSRVYHDLNSLASLRSQGDSRETIREAAEQFESVFFGMMLKSMRDASKAINPQPMFDSPSMDLFTDMYDKQLSLHLGGAQKSNLGLADVLVQQLARGIEETENNKAENNNNINDIPRVSTAQPVAAPAYQEAKPIEIKADTTERESNVVVSAATNEPQRIKEQPKEEKGIDFSSAAAFVQSLLPYAQKFASKLELDPKVLIAQAALETGWGKYVMRTADGVSSNNLFGIKAGSEWQGKQANVTTLEFESGRLQQQKANFRAYDNHAESFKDYVDFIATNPRYHEAVKVSSKATDYLQQLQSAGYATDPDYAKKINQIYHSETLSSAITEAEGFSVGIR